MTTKSKQEQNPNETLPDSDAKRACLYHRCPSTFRTLGGDQIVNAEHVILSPIIFIAMNNLVRAVAEGNDIISQTLTIVYTTLGKPKEEIYNEYISDLAMTFIITL